MDIEVYSDEFVIRNKYMGIGTLFIPFKDKNILADDLSNYRCLNKNNSQWNWDKEACINDYCKNNYHDLNNCEIHFSDIVKNTSFSKLQISKNWLQYIIDSNLNGRNNIFFNILILELEKLDKTYFGENNNIENSIYTKFYKSNIIYGCKRFFIRNNIKEVAINKIFHDSSTSKETHDYLSTNVPKLNFQKNIYSKTDEIIFLNSNHKKSKYPIESQFIQFIDLILGSTSQILFEQSKTKNKIELSNILYPLIKRLVESPDNVNSMYNYYSSQHISFFPKNKIVKHKDILNTDKLIRDNGRFHNNFKVPKKNEISENNLDDWF